jgi:hypothetical protein
LGARIIATVGGRRREMQYGERRRAQAPQRRVMVEVADDRNDAVRAQPGNVLGASREAVEAHLRTKQVGSSERHVTAADQQKPDHRLRPSRLPNP